MGGKAYFRRKEVKNKEKERTRAARKGRKIAWKENKEGAERDEERICGQREGRKEDEEERRGERREKQDIKRQQEGRKEKNFLQEGPGYERNNNNLFVVVYFPKALFLRLSAEWEFFIESAPAGIR